MHYLKESMKELIEAAEHTMNFVGLELSYGDTSCKYKLRSYQFILAIFDDLMKEFGTQLDHDKLNEKKVKQNNKSVKKLQLKTDRYFRDSEGKFVSSETYSELRKTC